MLMALTLFAGCSLFTPTPEPTAKPMTFHDKKNCSPKAYEYINKRDEAREKKITLYEHNQLQTHTVDFFLEKEKDLLSCSQGLKDNYACLAVGINSKSKLEFVDVADEVHKLDESVKNCLVKKLQSYDYRSLKAKFGNKFIMPLKMTAKKD